MVWDEWFEMRGVRWVVWDEGCEMSGVRWVVWDERCEMSCVEWVVWDELCEMSGVNSWCEMRGVRWGVWDEWCEMSCVRWVVWDELCEMRGVRWVAWDEGCEMSCVRKVVWDESCEMSGVGWVVWDISAAAQITHADTSSANANIIAATQICRRDTSSANANINAATQICRRDTSSANANKTAATQICHRDTSSANANITAATQICHRDASSANANITAATQICRKDTSSANAKITAATQICHRDTSSANANITAATQICRRDTSSANTKITAERHICHADSSSANTDITAAAIRAAAPSGSSMYCACHAKASRGHGGDYPRRSSFRKLWVLRLPRKSEPRPRRRLSAPQLLQEALRTAPATQKRAAATAATIRAAAPSGSCVYCACHAKACRGHGGNYPRRSSFRKLCVLRLPRKSAPRPRRRLSAPQLLQEALCTACHATARRGHGGNYPRRSSFWLSAPQLLQEALCTAPATQKRAAATAATIRAAALSGSSEYCACHAKASRGHGGDYPRRSSFWKLCVLRLPRKSEPRPRRRLSAPQLLQEALCTAPATQKRAAATAATIRAAAPSGSSEYCACHAKASRGQGGDYPRRSSFRKLCVLRLPRKSEPRPRRRLSAPQLLLEALSTAPATQKRAAATAATIRAAAPSGSSVYCACHAKASRGHGGDYPRRSSFRKLCVLRLPRRRLSAPQLLLEALCTAPAKQHVCEMRCVRWVVCEMSCVRWVD